MISADRRPQRRGVTTQRRSHRLSTPRRLLSLSIASLCVLSFILLLAYAQDQSCSADDSTSACSQPQGEQQQEDQPQFWHSYTIDDFFQFFHCSSILPGYGAIYGDDDTTPPPPSPRSIQERMLTPDQLSNTINQIEKLRDKYRNEINTVPIFASREQSSTVFSVPIIVGDAGVKGRGIYAQQDITKGTLVLDVDSNNVGIFKDAMQWRQFTYTLGVEDEELACNFMEWCWIQHVREDDGNDARHINEDEDIRVGHTVFLAFDESGLINNAEWGDDVANIRCGSYLPSIGQDDGSESSSEEWGPCKYRYYASRDIKAGDEILINYSEFEDKSQTGWIDFGVGIGITIGDRTSSSSASESLEVE
ncbi:hypothetical protein ACHAWO_007140 [Cyclotella atomus]|uniref:SET domain-containing protein n=1 Tax=Cyclotella atomus TaxID=382360 RepID=A0ABD3PQP6_9STRA